MQALREFFAELFEDLTWREVLESIGDILALCLFVAGVWALATGIASVLE